MDGSKAPRPKIFSLDRNAVWIEALVPSADGMREADPVLFQPDTIDNIRALGLKNSVVTLKSGVAITLSLTPRALLKKLETPQDAVLDLKPFVCLERKDALLERLREEFRREAEADKYRPIEALTFEAYVREPQKTDFRPITFKGADVHIHRIEDGNSILGGKNMTIRLKDPQGGPFSNGTFLMEGEREDFLRLCQEAFDAGKTTLDLKKFSLQHGTVRPEEKQPPGMKP